MVIPHTQEQTLIEDAGPSYPAIKDCIICRSNRLHYLFSVCGYRVVRCDDCGLLLINPQPSDEELARIYSSDYFFGGTSVSTQRGMEDQSSRLPIFTLICWNGIAAKLVGGSWTSVAARATLYAQSNEALPLPV